MKKILIVLIITISITGAAIGQVPNAFRYQAVIRNSSGDIVANQITALKISILSGSAVGQAVYAEIFQYVTNEFGIVSLNIGSGSTVLGDFLQIDWSANTYYLQIEIDIEGGESFQFMGTSQILAVPYAIQALNVINKDDADADPNNEIQTLSKNGSTITLSDGGLSVSSDDADADPNNEIQDLLLTGNTLTITNNLNATPISLSAYVGSNTDEQILSYTFLNNILNLSIGGGTGGNTINIPLVRADGGTFSGNISAPNLSGTNTGDMTDLQVVTAYQNAYSYFMNSSDRTDLDRLNLSTNFNVSGSATNLIAANGVTTLILPANGTLATEDYVNNSTLNNSLNYGRILVGNSSNQASDLDASADGFILIGNGNTINSRSINGDATLNNAGQLIVNQINGQNISLESGSFTTRVDNIILRANALGSDVTLPLNGTLANEAYVNAQISTNNSLSEGNILLGNNSGVATAFNAATNTNILIGNGTTVNSVSISGDATLANTGQFTLVNTTVTPGTYAGLTVNSKGLVIGGTTLTTLAGYGITDAMSTSHDANVITTADITNWNTAYGWGDHAAAGYLTSFSELDPVFLAWDMSTGISITASQVSDFQTSVTNNAAVLLNTAKNTYPVADATKLAGIAVGAEVNVNTDWNAASGDAQILNKPTSLLGYGITDAMSTSHDANVITTANITNWNTAFGWGNHATAGYLTSFSELDPVFAAWDMSTGISVTASQVSDFQTSVTNNAAVLLNTAKNTYPSADATKLAGIAVGAEVNVNADWNAASGDAQILNKPTTLLGYGITDAMSTSHDANVITTANITNWNTAFGWGNHATAGYLTAVNEVADEFTATVSQTNFTLSSTPSPNSIVKMYIDGLRVSATAYSVTGTTLTYTGAALSGAERIQFDYYY